MTRRHAMYAALAYTVLTILMTWPVARGLARDVAWDLGDSLLNMWILAWDGAQILAILRGDVGRIGTFFDASIFYPEPRTLAYSEHLIPQALQILPIYWATGNPILCYNLLFLSTFVLSGLGAYLLARELIGEPRAATGGRPYGHGVAFVAGLMFAFAPYRFAQLSHLQVLSVQWMPFVLYGLRRYFVTRRLRPLVGGAAAMVTQSLSSGYFLVFFAPFVVGYVLWEIAVRRLWRDRVMWRQVLTTGVASAIVLIPFLLPYAEARSEIGPRGLTQVASFAADTHSYLAAPAPLHLWGGVLRGFARPEGDLFPGLLTMLFAGIGVVAWLRHAVRLKPDTTHDNVTAAIRTNPTYVVSGFSRTLLVIAAVAFALAAVLLFQRRLIVDLGMFGIRTGSVNRPIVIGAAAVILAGWLSPAVRARCASLLSRPEFAIVAIVVGAWWLSLGPTPTASGRRLVIVAPYALFYEIVPGFDGMRVPARFGMIVALGLAVLAAFGLRALIARRWGPRLTQSLLCVIAVGVLVESFAVPLFVNRVSPIGDFVMPEARVYPPSAAPGVYVAAATLPPSAVIIELPFGSTDYDLRAVYYSAMHWRPLVNGYSGYFPKWYGRFTALLNDIGRHERESFDVLRESKATHVIVHEAAYLNDAGKGASQWLRRYDAIEVFRDKSDVIFQLPAH